MSKKHNKPQSSPSDIEEEQRLQELLWQHEMIGEEIIALVRKTSAAAEHLRHTLGQRRKGLLLKFPHPPLKTQTTKLTQS